MKHTYGRTWWPTDQLGPEGQVGENCMFIFVKYHNWKIFSKKVGNFLRFFFYSRVINLYKLKKILKHMTNFYVLRFYSSWFPDFIWLESLWLNLINLMREKINLHLGTKVITGRFFQFYLILFYFFFFKSEVFYLYKLNFFTKVYETCLCALSVIIMILWQYVARNILYWTAHT